MPDRNRCELAAAAEIIIEVPYVLRVYCDGESKVVLSAGNVRDALDELERRHPDLYRSVCDDTGAVRRHVNLFVNSSHIRDRNGIDSKLKPGDVLIILPAVSGG